MAQPVRIVQAEAWMAELEELLDTYGLAPLPVSGSSMTPFLAPGRDTVHLAKITGPLRRETWFSTAGTAVRMCSTGFMPAGTACTPWWGTGRPGWNLESAGIRFWPLRFLPYGRGSCSSRDASGGTF